MERVAKTKGGPVYPAIARAVQQLGHDIALARRSRRISTTDFAAQMGVSRATLQRLEAGDAGCSINTLAAALNALGRLDLLSGIIDQTKDDVGLLMMRGAVPQRVRKHVPKVSGALAEQGPVDLDEGAGW